MSKNKAQIAIARGDGIGPEIMDAVLEILKSAGAQLDITEVTVGRKAYEAGEAKGISDADFEKLEKSDAFLKAPLETPQGKGYSSVNVAIRKRFDLFANVRPSLSLEPILKAPNGSTDMVIVRENLEDLYAGIEYRPTPDVAVGRKVITKSESERIMRMAFEYARFHGRKKVTAIAKDNIQKFTDGAHFHAVFDEVAKDYPEIEADFYIADIGIAQLGARPANFDVVVTQNMYGDIGSDVVGEALGSVGLSGSANIGQDFAMFEAVHGTWPAAAGQNRANPSGLLMAAVMMLNHLGQCDVAEKVHNAWLKTIEGGIHTEDIFGDKSKSKAGTTDFTAAVIQRLGQEPQVLQAVRYNQTGGRFSVPQVRPMPKGDDFETTGADIDIQYEGSPMVLADKVKALLRGTAAKLSEIRTVRGDVVWPERQDCFQTDCLTLRLAFKKAVSSNEQDRKQAMVKVLGVFSDAANDITWREVRILTQNARTQEKNFR